MTRASKSDMHKQMKKLQKVGYLVERAPHGWKVFHPDLPMVVPVQVGTRATPTNQQRVKRLLRAAAYDSKRQAPPSEPEPELTLPDTSKYIPTQTNQKEEEPMTSTTQVGQGQSLGRHDGTISVRGKGILDSHIWHVAESHDRFDREDVIRSLLDENKNYDFSIDGISARLSEFCRNEELNIKELGRLRVYCRPELGGLPHKVYKMRNNSARAKDLVTLAYKGIVPTPESTTAEAVVGHHDGSEEKLPWPNGYTHEVVVEAEVVRHEVVPVDHPRTNADRIEEAWKLERKNIEECAVERATAWEGKQVAAQDKLQAAMKVEMIGLTQVQVTLDIKTYAKVAEWLEAGLS